MRVLLDWNGDLTMPQGYKLLLREDARLAYEELDPAKDIYGWPMTWIHKLMQWEEQAQRRGVEARTIWILESPDKPGERVVTLMSEQEVRVCAEGWQQQGVRLQYREAQRGDQVEEEIFGLDLSNVPQTPPEKMVWALAEGKDLKYE